MNHRFTHFCHFSGYFRGLLLYRSCSRPGVGRPWHVGEDSVRYSGDSSNKRGHWEGDCPNSFSSVGKYPPGHHTSAFSNHCYCCGDQWPGEKLDWTLEWTALPQDSWSRCFFCSFEDSLSQGEMNDMKTDF